MGEDLRKANDKFQEMIAKLKIKIDKQTEALLYIFYLEGFKDGSGMSQMVA